MISTTDGWHSRWLLGHGELHMPDRVISPLLSVAVFSKVNRCEKSEGDYYLSLGDERFLIREWWGREDDFRPIASRYNKVRVKMDGLEGLEQKKPGEPERTEVVQIINPPFV